MRSCLQVEGRGHSSFCGGVCVAEGGDRGVASEIRIRGGGVFRENGRKLGKYWDVCWVERAG
jgi:hypothetical protein